MLFLTVVVASTVVTSASLATLPGSVSLGDGVPSSSLKVVAPFYTLSLLSVDGMVSDTGVLLEAVVGDSAVPFVVVVLLLGSEEVVPLLLLVSVLLVSATLLLLEVTGSSLVGVVAGGVLGDVGGLEGVSGEEDMELLLLTGDTGLVFPPFTAKMCVQNQNQPVQFVSSTSSIKKNSSRRKHIYRVQSTLLVHVE
jgi:hypothetical protein